MFHFRKTPKIPSSSSPQTADALFNQISEKLSLSSSRRSKWRLGYTLSLTKYFLPRLFMFILFICILIGGIHFLTTPASIQNITCDSQSYEAQRISFQITHPFWIKSITASQNNSLLPVSQVDDTYYVDATENGVLLLEIETISHVRIEQEIIIDSIDDEAPHIQSHLRKGDEILIYLSDQDGAGIDWQAIQAIGQTSGTCFLPSHYDESSSFIIFPFPSEPLQITIPDLAGNYCIALLEPYKAE